MNSRETHLLKEQTKRDAQQKKAELMPLILFGTVRRSRKNSQKGYQKYEIEADVREAGLCDHAVRITLEDQGKVKKRRGLPAELSILNRQGSYKPWWFP